MGGVKAEITFDTLWNISRKTLNGSNKSQTIDVKCWNQKHPNPGINLVVFMLVQLKVRRTWTFYYSCYMLKWKLYCWMVMLQFTINHMSAIFQRKCSAWNLANRLPSSPATSSHAVVWTNACKLCINTLKTFFSLFRLWTLHIMKFHEKQTVRFVFMEKFFVSPQLVGERL